MTAKVIGVRNTPSLALASPKALSRASDPEILNLSSGCLAEKSEAIALASLINSAAGSPGVSSVKRNCTATNPTLPSGVSRRPTSRRSFSAADLRSFA